MNTAPEPGSRAPGQKGNEVLKMVIRFAGPRSWATGGKTSRVGSRAFLLPAETKLSPISTTAHPPAPARSLDVDAWPGISDPGKAFDPAHDFVVCANILGSCYGTTGPLSPKPGTNNRYRADFPAISVRDMVGLQKVLLDRLGIRQLALVTGPSLGGMQALEWAACYPEMVGSIVPIGVGAQHSPWCIGISEAQRAAIEADPNWNSGYYSDDQLPRQGLAAARMMAVCTYRSWHSFEERFARDKRSEQQYQVQSYLRYQGDKINRRFDANTYVTLTHAMHTHDLARGRGEYSAVLSKMIQPALVVSVSSDALYPPHEQSLLADALPNSKYAVLESIHGHDGFLIETVNLGTLIARFRASTNRDQRKTTHPLVGVELLAKTAQAG